MKAIWVEDDTYVEFEKLHNLVPFASADIIIKTLIEMANKENENDK